MITGVIPFAATLQHERGGSLRNAATWIAPFVVSGLLFPSYYIVKKRTAGEELKAKVGN